MSTTRGSLGKAVELFRTAGARATLAKVRFRVDFLSATLRATVHMRKLAATRLDLDQSLNVAFEYSVGEVSIAPAQIRSEVAGFLKMLAAAPPRNVLEIGTARGGTLFLLSRVAEPDALLASIDMPGGPFGASHRRESAFLLRALARKGQTLRLIQGDSHAEATRAKVTSFFGQSPLDVLLIDGDHRYEGVKADFEMYGPLVREGGWIAFHDIVPGEEQHVGGVPKFWQEVRSNYAYAELVHDWDQGGFGIGVLDVPSRGTRANVSP